MDAVKYYARMRPVKIVGMLQKHMKLTNEEVEQYPPNNKFGLYTRHLDLDLAWFMKSPNRFKAQPSWFSWKNTQEVLFYKDDRKPFRTYFFHQLKNYRKIMKRKRH